jgi:hypothetical protein
VKIQHRLHQNPSSRRGNKILYGLVAARCFINLGVYVHSVCDVPLALNASDWKLERRRSMKAEGDN